MKYLKEFKPKGGPLNLIWGRGYSSFAPRAETGVSWRKIMLNENVIILVEAQGAVPEDAWIDVVEANPEELEEDQALVGYLDLEEILFRLVQSDIKEGKINISFERRATPRA